MPYNPVQETSLLTNEQMGSPNYGEAIKQGLLGAQLSSETAVKPRDLAEKLLASHLKNKNEEILNKYLPQSEEARIQSVRAGTGNTLEQTLMQHIKNKYLEQHEQADIRHTNTQSDYYDRGGPGGGVQQKEEAAYRQQVSADNPGLSEDQIDQALDVYAQGGAKLPDGTPLAPISPKTQRSLDRLTKGATTTGLINTGVKAKQAEAEIEAASAFIQHIASPYGDTFLNMSPEQIKDSFTAKFGNDPKAQERLGQYMGIQALLYEVSQLRIRQAGGEPGLSATHELQKHSGQIIENYAPFLTGKEREIADKTINAGIKAMSDARNKVGVSPSMLNQKIMGGQKKTPLDDYEDISGTTQPGGKNFRKTYNLSTGEFE